MDKEYERGFKDGLKSKIGEEMQPMFAQILEGISEAIKGLIPRMIDIMEITANLDAYDWIPCSERLPEIRTPVLIKCKCRYGKNVGSVKISMGMWRERLTEGEMEWLFYGNFFDKDGIGARVHLSGWDVIAWMPMPEEGDNDA